MRTYGKIELLTFLDALDGHLQAPARLVLIGGSAASLAYGVENVTKDIDTFGDDGGSVAVQRAVALAQVSSGLKIPLGPAGVADAPYECESRVLPVWPGRWNWLELFALERHDLALSKVVRGVQGDIEHVVAIHRLHPLDYNTLVERYLGEMTHVIARVESLRLSFLWCVEELFGELVRQDAAQRIDDR